MHYRKYREIKQRGTPDFPIEYYLIGSRHLQYAMPYHWHDEMEFIRILSGTLEVTLEEEQITAAAGDFLIVNSGVLHGGTPIDCEYECLVFDTALLNAHPLFSTVIAPETGKGVQFANYYPANHIPTACSTSLSVPASLKPPDTSGSIDTVPLHTVVRRLFHTMSRRIPGYELITLGTLYEIFGNIVSSGLYTVSPEEDAPTHRHVALLKQSLHYIEQHYQEKITLDTLARTAGLSPKYFCRFFQEMTRRTPMDYLNYYRIERACFLLVNTDRSITEIAFDCGFHDLSYFIKTFKRYKNATPKQYLKTPI